MDKTKEKLRGKRILIWGYGREGKSTEKLLKTECEPASVEVYEGDCAGVDVSQYDYIFVSPGIPFEEDDPKFTSQTQVFMEEYGAQTVGITGTKGKSTTSAMLAKVLSACGKDAVLMGNIGLPCFDYIAQMTPETIAVFELSCHQCQRLTADPHIAVFLDLYEDHLDRYHTMEHYFDAKMGITKHQNTTDILYAGEDLPAFSTDAQVKRIWKKDVEEFALRIPGQHNHYNAEFVMRIARDEFGCDPAQIREALAVFGGLPHRLEYVGTYGEVDYYDDSISTIPEASIQAMGSVKNAETLILGGMDRGIDYDILVPFVEAHPEYHIICAYASGKRIAGMLGSCENVEYVEDLDAAVERAREVTQKGRAVVLSPASASYGYFKNFEARGDYFQEIIKK